MGVKRVLPSFDNKTYQVKKIQLEYLVDKNKQELLNDTQAYINASSNVFYTQMQASEFQTVW